MAWYCSHHCQKKNWVRGSHRKECPTMAWFLFERMAREEHGQAVANQENFNRSAEEMREAGAFGYCLVCLHHRQAMLW
jgi:hypothetical protein